MYLEHYGLREFPFSLTPDTSFFFGYGHYRDAFNTLIVALQNGEGFIKVTGEVGTGKTLLCRKLLNSLGEEYVTAYIPNPYLSPSALIMAVADELGLVLEPKEGTHRALKQITHRLIELNAEAKKVVLCIDEAQAMPEKTLETLRLITNLETEKRKLLHVVLFGQPELDERLKEKSIRQLRQRITFSYTLQPIDQEGIAAYLQHRLLIAGGNGEAGFDSSAVKQLYKGSQGFPRLINILAHKALMLGYGQGIKQISASQVKAAVADTEGARKESTTSHKREPRLTTLLASLAVILMLTLAYRFMPFNGASPKESAGIINDATATTSSAVIRETQVTPPEVVADIAPPPTEPAHVEVSLPRLTGITPNRLEGSWEPQQLLLHGENLPTRPALLVRWDGREKLLPPERIEWLDEATLRITLTTGVRSMPWELELIRSNGERSTPISFDVIGQETEQPTDITQ